MSEIVNPRPVLFSGSLNESFPDALRELAERLGIPIQVKYTGLDHGREHLVRVSAEHLETFTNAIIVEAKESLDFLRTNSKLSGKPIADFASAMFPQSAERLEPMREIYGEVKFRQQKIMDNLPPVIATPGYIFGTADKT